MRRSLWRDMAPGSLALKSANRRRLPWWERHPILTLTVMWIVSLVLSLRLF